MPVDLTVKAHSHVEDFEGLEILENCNLRHYDNHISHSDSITTHKEVVSRALTSVAKP